MRTRHGLLPVPAPATARLLEGFTWRDDGIGGERVTPTGAAILRHLVEPRRHAASSVACRAPAPAPARANFRVSPTSCARLLFEHCGGRTESKKTFSVLSFEIDDMTGEEIGVAADRLRAVGGVRDLVLMPAIGKKGRPVHTFRLLVEPTARDAVAEACFTETATIGLRWQASTPRRAAAGECGCRRGAREDGDAACGSQPQGGERRPCPIAGLEARRAAKRHGGGAMTSSWMPFSRTCRASRSRSAAGWTA